MNVSLGVVEYTTAAEWDAVVAAHPRGHLLQSWAWGELRRPSGWRPLRLAVVDRASPSASPRAAAQVLVRRVLGGSVCFVRQGPMFSGEATLDRALLEALRRVAVRSRALFLHLEPNVLTHAADAAPLVALLRRARFRVGESEEWPTSIHLDLAPPVDRLFEGLSRGHRRHLRRAEAAGAAVRVGTTAADFDSFYAIMVATAARARFAINSREYYRRAWELCGDRARLLIASLAGAGDVAALLVFGFGREAQNMFGGTTGAGLDSGVNYLLHWHAVRWARDQGYDRYDFWGIPDSTGAPLAAPVRVPERAPPTGPSREHGITQFKKGWGGEVVRYVPAHDQVYLEPAYRLWRSLRWARKLHGRVFHP